MEKFIILLTSAFLCSIGFSQFNSCLQSFAGLGTAWIKTIEGQPRGSQFIQGFPQFIRKERLIQMHELPENAEIL